MISNFEEEINCKCLKRRSSGKCLDEEEIRVDGLHNKEHHELYCSGRSYQGIYDGPVI
jgi:hypothetical protein